MAKDGKIAMVNLLIVPDKVAVSDRIYANYVQVAHSNFDVTLTFCDVLPLDANQQKEVMESKILKAPVQVEVAIPMALVESLVNALSTIQKAIKKAQEQ